ncbi:FkbM family methyltransferase [Geodermatophilus sp. SYSU D00703]
MSGPPRHVLARARGIGRSLALYHGVPGRHRRMVRFYGQFLGPGDVGFDIGAHVGSRVRAWRRLGARVVAVEPQPDLLRVLRLFFGRDDDVLLVPSAVGARPGRARLDVSTATPTVSSMSPDWQASVTTDRSFARVRWDRSVEVEVATLDGLIAAHGVPAFCKIDVEGFEVEVLQGLTRPLPALSFEYLPPAHDAALAALDLVERLGATAGGYRYNYSPIETMRLAADRWLDAADLVRLLERFRPLGRSGDVYARLAATAES